MVRPHDAGIVGSGPNGLAAAITLARGGRSVLVREAQQTLGGGARSAALTLPGFVHDVCSAVHPLAVASPFFRSAPLQDHGLEWIQPGAPLAHPFDDGTAAVLERSIASTAALIGGDGGRYRRLMEPYVASWDAILEEVLHAPRFPRDPVAFARFALAALRSARGLATATFEGARARGLIAGLAAHAALPLTAMGSSAFALVLGASAHAAGWPIPRGGAQSITTALVSYLRSLGGTVVEDDAVDSIDECQGLPILVLDLTPRQVLRVAGRRLPALYRARLGRFRYGPGAFKLDWALREPIPWKASDCRRAGTVHLGGTLEEIAAAERAPWRDEIAERPFVLLSQPTLFDPTRAPPGRHVAWAYCHVAAGSAADMTARIEAQVERFAPGFREIILARNVRSPAVIERSNANLVGGDINGGALDFSQLLFRPIVSLSPHRTPVRGLYLCSASTPPGPGVHGMCGYRAARAALADVDRGRVTDSGEARWVSRRIG